MKNLINLCMALGVLIFNALTTQALDTNQMMKERWSIECDADNKVEYDLEVEISFYTSLLIENSSYGAVDARGNDLSFYCVALPRDYKLGTQIEFEGIEGIFIGNDRGSKKHIRIKDDGTIRIDMFVPRIKGELDKEYYDRVNNYGKHKTKARIIVDN